MTFPALTWELCDREQTVLATLDDRREGASVTVSRHAARTASVPLSLEDDAAALATSMDTVLRCQPAGWSEPLFVGRVLVPEIGEDDDTEGLVINAIDPWQQLEKAMVFVSPLPGFSPAVAGFAKYSATDQAQIMWALIALRAANELGIAEGSLPASFNRDLSFAAGSVVADGVLGVANLDAGPDFELTPTEADDGTLVTFNAFYPQQGTDKTASVIFEFGYGDESAIAFSYASDGGSLVNRATVIGDQYGVSYVGGIPPTATYPTHLTYTAEHAASIAQYGAFEVVQALSGTTDPSVLEAVAKAIVAANAFPAHKMDFTPDPDAGLEFGPDDDYWFGDTIAVNALLPNEETILATGRVSGAVFTEHAAGVDIDLNCDPVDSASGVSGSGTYEVVVDPADGSVFPPGLPVDNASEVDIGGGKKKKRHEKKGK